MPPSSLPLLLGLVKSPHRSKLQEAQGIGNSKTRVIHPGAEQTQSQSGVNCVTLDQMLSVLNHKPGSRRQLDKAVGMLITVQVPRGLDALLTPLPKYLGLPS